MPPITQGETTIRIGVFGTAAIQSGYSGTYPVPTSDPACVLVIQPRRCCVPRRWVRAHPPRLLRRKTRSLDDGPPRFDFHLGEGGQSLRALQGAGGHIDAELREARARARIGKDL